MKKHIIANILYGASAMAGIIAVSKGCKFMVDRYTQRDEDDHDETIGEHEFLEEESE